MEYIAEVPIIEVDGETAICDGGDTFGGHPRVYLPLHKSNGQPETCKYCGLRYKMKKHHH
jgi:NADH dehydrogenase (ubiquinone) Fe-S protein 6